MKIPVQVFCKKGTYRDTFQLSLFLKPDRISLLLICIVTVVIYAAGQNEGKVEVAGDGAGEIVVTLSEPDRSVLVEGDALRKAHEHNEAIRSYQNVLDMDGIDAEVRAEAQYNIGLSYTWLGDYDKADVVFHKMLETYKNNENAVGYAEYCLAWIEVQKGEYLDAIERLQRSLDTGTITDRELGSRTQFMIGRTYFKFLNDKENANQAFAKVLAKYPGTKTANHPYLDYLKEK